MNNENKQNILPYKQTLTTHEINEGIDGLELGDMSNESSYLSGLQKQLNNHWSKVKAKLNEDINLKIEYTGIGAEPFVILGKKVKEMVKTDLGDMSGEKSYLAGLKRHVNDHWSTVKAKLNEDIKLK